MQITLNLASRPFADVGPTMRLLRTAMIAMAVVCIALGIGLYFVRSKAAAARAREHSLDASIARLQHERQGYETLMRQPQNAEVLQQADTLNRLIDAKAFSWTLAMEDLETVLPGGVQVTTLEPTVDKKDGHITVRLRVVGPRDKAVELVQNLEHSRRFLQPRIIGETAEGSNNPNAGMQPVSASNRVNFDVLADYNPATPEERKAANRKAEKANAATAPESSTQPSATTNGPGLRRPPHTGVSRARKAARPNPQPGAPR